MRNLATTGLIVAVVLVICTSLASPARAWDHDRKGFILGGALGAFGLWDPSDSKGIGWLAGDVKIGYAPSDRLLIYYSSRNFVFPALMGSLSAGVNYYLKPVAPAFFITGGGGVFGGMVPAVGGWGGYSAYTGAGYEFARHWGVALEAGYTWFELGTEENVSGHDGLDVRILVSLTGY